MVFFEKGRTLGILPQQYRVLYLHQLAGAEPMDTRHISNQQAPETESEHTYEHTGTEKTAYPHPHTVRNSAKIKNKWFNAPKSKDTLMTSQ